MVGMKPLERSLEKLDDVRKKKLSDMIGSASETVLSSGTGQFCFFFCSFTFFFKWFKCLYFGLISVQKLYFFQRLSQLQELSHLLAGYGCWSSNNNMLQSVSIPLPSAYLKFLWAILKKCFQVGRLTITSSYQPCLVE